MESDALYRAHMREAIAKINRYVAGMTFESFCKDERTQDAVVRELEIIGEASRSVSDDFKHTHERVPWTQIAGMRNKLIHEYFGVDVEIVWKTINSDLKTLEQELG